MKSSDEIGRVKDKKNIRNRHAQVFCQKKSTLDFYPVYKSWKLKEFEKFFTNTKNHVPWAKVFPRFS